MAGRSEEHTSELQSQSNLVCRLLLEKKKKVIEAPVSSMLVPSSLVGTRSFRSGRMSAQTSSRDPDRVGGAECRRRGDAALGAHPRSALGADSSTAVT